VKYHLLQQGGMMVSPMMNGHLQGPMPVSGQVATPVMLTPSQQQVCWSNMSLFLFFFGGGELFSEVRIGQNHLKEFLKC